MNKYLSAAIISAIFFGFFPKTSVLAESGCKLTQSAVGELGKIQENASLDDSYKIREELRIRKALLNNVVDCAAQELLALKYKFENAGNGNEEVRTLRSQFSPWFFDTLNYYSAEKARVDNLGIQGTKEFARNFRLWREGNFQPISKLIANFVIWSQNQELMSVAKIRLEQIKRSIEFFGLTFNDNVRTALQDADGSLQKTLAFNSAAKEILRTYGSADDAASEINLSLENLSLTYKNIFELVQRIAEEIKK